MEFDADEFRPGRPAYIILGVDTDKRRSKYASANLLFDWMNVDIVSCDSKPEFSRISLHRSSVCGVAYDAWEPFSEELLFALNTMFETRPSPASWVETVEGVTVGYYGDQEDIAFDITVIAGGFMVISPVTE